jgi:hypothetical protein
LYCSNEAAIKTTDMNNTVTAKQKFANYFNLKEDFYVEDTHINGWVEHEGQEFGFQAYLILDDVFDFDEEYVEKYKDFYTRDLEGANGWLEICMSTLRGCEYEYDIDNFKSTEYDCIEDFIGQEAVHDYGMPYIEAKHSAITIEEVA